MYKKLIVVLFFSIMVGCTNNNITSDHSKDYGQEESYKFDPPFQQGGTSIEFSNDQTIKLKENEEFETTLTIGNLYPFTNIYETYVFVNYQQVNYLVDAKEHKSYLTNLNSNEESDITISIPNIPEGIHDVLVISVRKPDKLLTEDYYIDSSSLVFGGRFQVTKGSDELPKITWKQITANQGRLSVPLHLSIGKNLTPQNILTYLNKENANDLFLNFQASADHQHFAIIYMLQNDHLSTNFIRVKGDGVVQLPLMNKINKDGNLSVFLIKEPYTWPQKRDIDSIDWGIDAVNRVTID